MLVEHGGRKSDPLGPARVALAHAGRVDGNAGHGEAGSRRLERPVSLGCGREEEGGGSRDRPSR